MVLLSNLLDILLPHTCPACEGYSNGICDECLQKLPRTEQAMLRQNSTETALVGERYSSAIKKAMHLERAAAYLFFEKEHPIQQVIHKMKYADQPRIGYQLGRQAAIEMQYTDFFDKIDVILPVPLHTKRMKERGYNQSEFIARGISEVTGIPIDTTHVIRVRNTPKQAMQSGEGRRQNVAEAFAVLHPEQMYHKHILIVDDLITTGETMRSCLKTMKQFRGAKFSVFALCKAR